MRVEILDDLFPLSREAGSTALSFLPTPREARYLLTPEHPGAMRSFARRLRGSQHGRWRMAGALLEKAPFLGKHLLKDPPRKILTSLARELGLPFEPAGCWAQQGHQLLTILLFAEGAVEPGGVLRLAAPDYEKDLFREKEILERLAVVSELKDCVPRVLGYKVTKNFCTLAQTALTGERPSFGRDAANLQVLIEQCRVWLEKLAISDVPKDVARSNRYAEALCCLKELWPEEKELLARMAAIVNGEANVRVVITHRDFAAANLLVTEQKLHVIDWGNGHYGYPLTDFARFCLNVLRDQSKDRSCPAVLSEALAGPSPLWRELLTQARRYSEFLKLNAEDARALWLLSLFDYIAGYHGPRMADWLEAYAFLKQMPVFLRGPLDPQKVESVATPA